MKEDVLEQIIDETTRKSLAISPSTMSSSSPTRSTANTSRGMTLLHRTSTLSRLPLEARTDRVRAVSCKSWQSGFRADWHLAGLEKRRPSHPRRASWKHFRELWIPKWSEAFRERIFALTGAHAFHYSIACTRVVGDGDAWTAHKTIKENLGPGSKIRACAVGLQFHQIKLTPAPSEIGRLAQLLKSARVVTDD